MNSLEVYTINNIGLYPSMNNDRPTTSIYPGTAYGIDLRNEMEVLLSEYGYYILVRHYDRSTYSQYWNNIAKEAVGGPAYEYTDYIALGRKVARTTETGATGGLEVPHPMGLVTIPYVTFYIKWDIVYTDSISNEDEIMEFTWSNSRVPVVGDAIPNVTNRYNILDAADLLGDTGRREYYMCICRSTIK